MDSVLATLFVHPLTLPAGARLWMVIPLVLCIAVVYRATRSRQVAELPLASLKAALNILVGMVAIAVGFYGLHEAVLRWGM